MTPGVARRCRRTSSLNRRRAVAVCPPPRGVILAVGPGRVNKKTGNRTPLQLKTGDRVLFTSWAGDEFKDRAKADEILIMHEEDVLAVIE